MLAFLAWDGILRPASVSHIDIYLFRRFTLICVTVSRDMLSLYLVEMLLLVKVMLVLLFMSDWGYFSGSYGSS